jgi:sulfatase maturation enzyme AslB (radical SAM superfamily)
MVTNRCNLRCSYCVLENAPDQLRKELNLESKKELVSHLYHKLGFRRLTLSGGEVVIFGKRAPTGFIELLRHIRTLRSPDPKKNLAIEMYTNGTYLTEAVVEEMTGVVDMIAVTIDGAQDNFLTQLGRNTQKFHNYFDRVIHICSLLTQKGIEVKLHSVISQNNHDTLGKELEFILSSIEKGGGKISRWKFFQYMSYDDPKRDQAHAIPKDTYIHFKKEAQTVLKGYDTKLHFKDNEEMNASLFNILSYGNAQYMREGDSWTTSQRTEDLRTYPSMLALFEKHDIDEERFRRFHEITL